jgi:hypothetical protein
MGFPNIIKDGLFSEPFTFSKEETLNSSLRAVHWSQVPVAKKVEVGDGVQLTLPSLYLKSLN